MDQRTFRIPAPNEYGRVVAAPAAGADADTDVWPEADVLFVPELTAPRTWRIHGSAAMPFMVTRVAPSPHPLRLERADGSLIVELPAGAQSWASLDGHTGRWELAMGNALPPGGGACVALVAGAEE